MYGAGLVKYTDNSRKRITIYLFTLLNHLPKNVVTLLT
jgi:hypothetical protein